MDTRTEYKGATRRKTDASEVARQVAIEKRRERARLEPFDVEPELPGQVLGYFTIVGTSGFPYTVEIRDPDRLLNRCSCPDYTGNNLGTCKHVEAVLLYIRRKHRGKLQKARQELIEKRRLHVQLGLAYDHGWRLEPYHDESLDVGILRLVQFYITPHRHELEQDPAALAFRIKQFEEQVADYGGTVGVDADVWEHLAHVGQRQERAREREDLLRRVEAGEEQLDLLNLPLYPFQLVGVLFLAYTERGLLADDMGLGKAQPLDAKILTPAGWKLMGEMQVGDEIINAQGRVSQVRGVYPQGIKEVFRVEFTDGSATECCEDHLWQVNGPIRRRRGYAPRVLPLSHIRTNLRNSSGNLIQFIPMVQPIEFRQTALPLHPYLLGVLLGDGGLSGNTVRISSADDALLERVRCLLPGGVSLVHNGAYDWTITQGRVSSLNPLTYALRCLGLMGLRSEHKFIPDSYKFGSLETRIALLQGLLDTDGHVRPADNNLEFSSASKRLATDVRELVQSLGGRAAIRSKQTVYSYRGQRLNGRIAYRMSVALPAEIPPFALGRKAQVYHPRFKYPPVRAIKSVVPIGCKECQCIAVDSPDGLYVTDDYIVTHNTAQAIGAARLLMRQRGLGRVLVITPASVKLQWAREVERFAGEPVTVVAGSKAKRAKQYANPGTFVVINYELVLRDFEQIQALEPGLIILDEAQRIKNWQAKTTRRVKELDSPYAFVLTGTPLENRLEELYSVVQFLDPRLLGPAWQFLAEHTVQDAFGQITGYKDLEGVRRRLAPLFLRRRKQEVLEQLPERVDNYYWVDLKPEQNKLYRPLERQLLDLLSSRREWGYEDRSQALRLVTHLRELADAAQLVAPAVNASSKLDELANIVPVLVAEGHKLLIFSQWERMTRLVQETLERLEIPSLRLHGGVAQAERDRMTARFMSDPAVPVFISTDAGGLGLNLQAASYVVNVDLPWNPARLEQRIGRAHRMGQEKTVNVINVIASGTIEERVLEILYKKQELFTELFDAEADTIDLETAGHSAQFRDLVARLVKRQV